jgi:adenosine deaminase
MTWDIDGLPKALLHDHLDGGLRVLTVLDLADAAGYRGLPTTDPEELGRWFHQADSGSLERYLEAFEHTIAVMQTSEALERAAFEAVEDLHADGVVYAELRFGPLLHTAGGLATEDVFEAVLAGVRRGAAATGVETAVIATGLRQTEDTEAVVRAAIPFRDAGVVAFDLAGPEAGHPAADHLPACRLAREHGFSLTIHAGEGDGAHSVWQAVARCGARRVGHGARLIESMVCDDGAIVDVGALGRVVRDERIALELCITSNLHTSMYDSAKDHPFGAFYRAGFAVTLNTDNRLMSDIRLSDEYRLAAETFGLTITDLGRVTVNALEAGFGDWTVRKRLIDEVVRPAYANGLGPDSATPIL